MSSSTASSSNRRRSQPRSSARRSRGRPNPSSSGGGGSRNKKYKIVLLGEGRVGKTSILVRYCRNEYDGKQPPTLNASYMDKRINIGGSKSMGLSIWDTAGQERFHALGPIYYRDADAALIVYDITDAESFTRCRKWVKELRKIVGDDIDIAIAGNKVDLEKNRHVDKNEALEFAASVGATHFNTSAKLNKGLDDAFLNLAKKISKKQERMSKNSSSGGGASLGGAGGHRSSGAPKLVLVDESTRGPAKQGGCC